MWGPCHSIGLTGTKATGTRSRASTTSSGVISSYSTFRIGKRLPAGGEEHLWQDVHVQPGLLRRRPARLVLRRAAVEVLKLEREALPVERGGADVVRPSVALAASVDRRILLEPRRGEDERPHG